MVGVTGGVLMPCPGRSGERAGLLNEFGRHKPVGHGLRPRYESWPWEARRHGLIM